MNKVLRIVKKQDVGSIGIGAMIVFIAMVLVAGIAASVLVQTSTKLEAQAMTTGSQTTKEVATGLHVSNIIGYCNKTVSPTTADISKIAIEIRTRAGSEEIDLSETYLELSDSNRKVIFNYTATYFIDVAGNADIFLLAAFPNYHHDATTATDGDGSRFGVIVLEDADSTISSTTPVMNKGDKVFLCINATAAMARPGASAWPTGGISERYDMWGMVVPEHGSPGVIKFTTPASYPDWVMDLQ